MLPRPRSRLLRPPSPEDLAGVAMWFGSLTGGSLRDGSWVVGRRPDFPAAMAARTVAVSRHDFSEGCAALLSASHEAARSSLGALCGEAFWCRQDEPKTTARRANQTY